MDVHRVRFVEATPAAIHRVCFSQRGSRPKLAVGRGDGSVEVRQMGSHVGSSEENGTGVYVSVLIWRVCCANEEVNMIRPSPVSPAVQNDSKSRTYRHDRRSKSTLGRIRCKDLSDQSTLRWPVSMPSALESCPTKHGVL